MLVSVSAVMSTSAQLLVTAPRSTLAARPPAREKLSEVREVISPVTEQLSM